MTITPQTIAKHCQWSGDDAAMLFIETLTECNFHTEAEIIGVVWQAMQVANNKTNDVNIDSMIDEIKSCLGDLSRGKQ